jgi:predicted dinucleotide-binding enzyme
VYRDAAEQDRIRSHSREIVRNLLDEPGFIGIVTGFVLMRGPRATSPSLRDHPMIDSMTPIAVLGAGKVGQALATRLHEAGFHVWFGVREAPPLKDEGAPKRLLADAEPEPEPLPVPEVPRLGIPDAVRHAGVVFVALPAAAARDVLVAAPLPAGVIVVDCTNPVRWENGPVLAPPAEGSMAAHLAAALPTVRVVKAFNHFGAEIQAEPAMAHGAADAYVAGDDAAAKADIIGLAGTLGFTGRDAGPLRNAALLEALAVLWIHLATVGGQGRQFAFRQDGR